MTETLVERRRRLLRSDIGSIAIRLFAERGFDAVTINDIADAAGTSPRTFFRYFATKDEVVLDYERYLLDRLGAALDGARPTEGPVTALREAFKVTSHVEPDARARVLADRAILRARAFARGRAHDRITESTPLIAAIAARMGVDDDDPRPRTTVAAIERGRRRGVPRMGHQRWTWRPRGTYRGGLGLDRGRSHDTRPSGTTDGSEQLLTVEDRFDLTGRVAVVTGGSRGIGRAIVHTFAEAGADVVVASRKLDACEATAREVIDATGRRAQAVACHVGHWTECDALLRATLERFGRIDVLVNNAGMSPLYDYLAEVSEDLYDKTLAVNLKGPFRLGALVGTHMAEHDGGSIINVGTIGSLIASPNELPYACAKAGLNALTVGLAEAFAPKVRVNSILPGPIDTDVTKAWTAEQRSGSSVPLERMGRADEIAGAALYLASDASSYTTGATIRVDGGFTRKV